MKLRRKDRYESITRISICSGSAVNTTFEYEPESRLLKRWVVGDYGVQRGMARLLPEDAEEITVSQEAAEFLTYAVESLDFSWYDWEMTEEVKQLAEREDVYFTEVFIAWLAEGSKFSYCSTRRDANSEFVALFDLFRCIWKDEAQGIGG